LDLIAHCTDAGEIVIYESHLAVMNCEKRKLRKLRQVNSPFRILNNSKKLREIFLFIDYYAHGFG